MEKRNSHGGQRWVDLSRSSFAIRDLDPPAVAPLRLTRPCVPWIPWPFTPGAACVAMASNFRDGGAFFLTGTSFPRNAG